MNLLGQADNLTSHDDQTLQFCKLLSLLPTGFSSRMASDYVVCTTCHNVELKTKKNASTGKVEAASRLSELAFRMSTNFTYNDYITWALVLLLLSFFVATKQERGFSIMSTSYTHYSTFSASPQERREAQW